MVSIWVSKKSISSSILSLASTDGTSAGCLPLPGPWAGRSRCIFDCWTDGGVGVKKVIGYGPQTLSTSRGGRTLAVEVSVSIGTQCIDAWGWRFEPEDLYIIITEPGDMFVQNDLRLTEDYCSPRNETRVRLVIVVEPLSASCEYTLLRSCEWIGLN